MVDDLWVYCLGFRLLHVHSGSRPHWYCDCRLNFVWRLLSQTKNIVSMDPKTQRERDEAVKRKYIYKPVFIIFGILNLLIIALFVISL